MASSLWSIRVRTFRDNGSIAQGASAFRKLVLCSFGLSLSLGFDHSSCLEVNCGVRLFPQRGLLRLPARTGLVDIQQPLYVLSYSVQNGLAGRRLT